MNWLQAMGMMMLALAALLLVFAAAELVRTGAFVLGSETTVGEVRDYRVSERSIPFTDPDSGRRYYPEIVFEVDGERNEFSGHQGSSRRRFDIGEQVRVAYNPDNLSDARIDSFAGIWGRPMVLLLTSGVFALAGGLPYFRFKRARRRT